MMQAAEAPAPPPAFTEAVIRATVQIDQPIAGTGRRHTATAFLVEAPRPDGRPRTVMVTAAHVLEQMPADEARLAWRFEIAPGEWRRELAPIAIRVNGAGRWTRHPEQDIAVMEITAPAEFARAAIPLAWLGDAETPERLRLRPGDEMLTVGYPGGLSSNPAGFPILRVGRAASFPIAPVRSFPLFLLDFRVFAGNSGGPVFVTDETGPGAPRPPVIVGVLTRQTEQDGRAFELGVIAHAVFVRETLALLDRTRGRETVRGTRP